MLDIGTGDGLFVYRAARADPHKFFIGIDPNQDLLRKISEKIYRKPAKGGVANALFVKARVEDLPAELDGIASAVFINFPWGSLLKVTAIGDAAGLSQIRRVCRTDATVKIVLAIDPIRDQAEVARLHLPDLSLNYLESTLAAKFHSAGLDLIERRLLKETDWLRMETSWGRRLRGNAQRTGIYLAARAVTIKIGGPSMSDMS